MIVCANPAAQYQSYQAEIDAAVLRVLGSNKYILGPEVSALEEEFSRYIGAAGCVGVANGTDALELALRALRIGPGDEVITVSHTAVATVAAIEATGATAVLVDVDPVTYTLDANQLDTVRSPRTRAVIAVHLYGQAADLDRIQPFCQRHGLALVEDVSQAHGATWHGRRLGSIGDIACFSCYPTKNLGALGDGGLVASTQAALVDTVRMLREYGWKQRYISDLAGRNSRLDELQAAVLRIKLRHLDADNARRRALAAVYDAALAGSAALVPAVRACCEPVYHLYVVQVQDRATKIAALNAQDIFPGVHYPVPIHQQNAYAGRVRTAASMRVTERLAGTVLSLPMYPELPPDDARTVARTLAALG